MNRKIVSGIAAGALALGLLGAPVAYAYEPGSEPVTAEEVAQGLEEISFESSNGAYVLPEQTIELTADALGDGIEIRNAYIETAPGQTSPQWTVQRSVNADGLPVLAITAPKAPEEQFGSTQEYGEYIVHVRTSNWNSYYFTINFAPELPVVEEPETQPTEPAEETTKPGKGPKKPHPVFGEGGKFEGQHPVFGEGRKFEGQHPVWG